MGNNEDSKSSKSDKSDKSTSPAPPEQNGMHMYPPPDWAAMQAYYGPRVPLPQYYNTAYVPGHGPHPHPYMWAPPQAMIPSFAAPYAAIYSQGGVYAHPGVPIGSPVQGPGALPAPSATETLAATTLSIQTPGKTSRNTSGGSADNESGDTGGSSQRSGDTLSGGVEANKKRSRMDSPDIEKAVKLEIQANSVSAMETNVATNKVLRGAAGSVANGKMENMQGSHIADSKLSLDAQPAGLKLSSEGCYQSERQLKQERRKQSNRESARRSRLRKQAETEELAVKVKVLMAENNSLKSEIHQMAKNSEKLKFDNTRLVEKLNNAKLGKADRIGTDKDQPLSTENLLSRVNNSGSVVIQDEEGEMHSNNNNNATKLRQLLDTSPRNDAVAAS